MAAKSKIQKRKGIQILDLTQDSLKDLSAGEMRVIGGCLPDFPKVLRGLIDKISDPHVDSCGKIGDQCSCLQVWRPDFRLWSNTTTTLTVTTY